MAEKYFIDGLFDFSLGMNAGDQPLLLKRNQLAFAGNATMRGTFLSTRPANQQIKLNYGGSAALQSAVEQGLFQGACFYQPDFGPAAIVAQISGRIFLFSVLGATASVSEISVPGSLNSATVLQAWLWQSENFVIINDGINLPIFYDGNANVSRRSYGPQVQLATISANFTAPAVGQPVTVTLSSAYTGPLNVPVIVVFSSSSQAFYQTVGSGSGSYLDNLTSLYGSPGSTISSGTTLVVNPNIIGISTTFAGQSFPGTTEPPGFVGSTVTLSAPVPGTVSIGQTISFGGILWTVASISGSNIGFNNAQSISNGYSIPAGTQMLTTGASLPITTAAVTTANFTMPAIGAVTTPSVSVDRPFGTTPAIVYDNAGNQFSLVGVTGSGGSGTALTLININDTPGTTHNSPSYNVMSVPELPAGRMGVYGLGRNWMALTDGRSYIGSDIVGSSSGTPAAQYRDAPLKITQNSTLAAGGVFVIPGPSGQVGDIRALRFAATLDTSLGQGPLTILTPRTVFTCNAPIDNTAWQKLTNPIQTVSMIDNGALGQNSTIVSNGDIVFRSIDGIRSLIQARQYFARFGGNPPLSFEVSPILNVDNPALLNYGSAIKFQNRLLMTASPQVGAQGIYHASLVALNYDNLSTLTGTNPPAYDGIWSGLNVLQMTTGMVAGVQRAFAFHWNNTANPNKIDLWEILTDEAPVFADTSNSGTTPIIVDMQSGSLFKDIKNKGPLDLCRLEDGEIYIDQVSGSVNFQAFYLPDQLTNWVPWTSFTVQGGSNYYPRLGLGKPQPVCPTGGPQTTPSTLGYTFQFRLIITGNCRFLGAKFKAAQEAEPFFAPAVCGKTIV